MLTYFVCGVWGLYFERKGPFTNQKLVNLSERGKAPLPAPRRLGRSRASNTLTKRTGAEKRNFKRRLFPHPIHWKVERREEDFLKWFGKDLKEPELEAGRKLG